PEGWLVLVGASGCGKTHIGAAIANRCRDAIEQSPTRVEVAPSALWVAVPKGVSSPLFRG
ncbi:MAG: hypothetical protein ACE1ZN_05530, partial [Dehalococcoidia bacterium]